MSKLKPYLLQILIVLFFFLTPLKSFAIVRFFPIQAIDTMKFSRDAARAKINDPSYDTQIELQVRNIAKTGATHISLGTPYDEEFYPYLLRWVTMARKYQLNVWFRGNFSGWEGWFSYTKNLDRQTHIQMTKDFILTHAELFQDGDVFTACPECENGGPGDPRQTGDVAGFRNFLIDEYNAQKQAFVQIGKQVIVNYDSMNGDVARLVMDKKTTKALGGAVTVDHYVSTPQKLATDIKGFAKASGGNVVLGEFGAPIPDLNGDLTQTQQADWIDNALKNAAMTNDVVAVNYWTNKASSTALWNEDDSPREAVKTVTSYYSPTVIQGSIVDDLGAKIANVQIKTKIVTDSSSDGSYVMPVLANDSVLFTKSGYISVSVNINDVSQKVIKRDVVLTKLSPSWFYRFLQNIFNLFPH